MIVHSAFLALAGFVLASANPESAKAAFLRSGTITPFRPHDFYPYYTAVEEDPFTVDFTLPSTVSRKSSIQLKGTIAFSDNYSDPDVVITLENLPSGISLQNDAPHQLKVPRSNVVPFVFDIDIDNSAVIGTNNFRLTVNEKSYIVGFAVDSEIIPLHIFAFNDFHGRIVNSGSGSTRTGAVALGMTLAGLTEEHPNHIVLSCGDSIGGSLFESSSLDDVPTMKIMQELGVQAAVVGNHEFDRGYDFLVEAQEILGEQLGANVFRDGETVFTRYKIVEQGGLKVGVVGVVTDAVPSLVVSSAIQGLEFRPALPIAKEAARDLKDQGCDVVVCLYHQGGATNSLEEELQTSTEFGDFLRGILEDNDIDIVMSGHTHRLYAWDQSGRPIIQAGAYASDVTHFEVNVNEADRRIVGSIIGSNVAAQSPVYWNTTNNAWQDGDTRIPEDDIPQNVRNIRDIVVEAIASSDELGNVVIGRIAEAFPNIRGAETPLGLLIADAMLHEVSAREGHEDTEIAIMNDGGIRADLPFHDNGVVTVKDVITVQPFANTLFVAYMSGALLKTILEQQWQEGKTFTHPVAGMTYVYDNRRPVGEKIIPETMLIAGEVMVPERIYKVVINSFLAGGGDGFTGFLEAEVVDTGVLDSDVLISYISHMSATTGPLVPSRFERIFNIEDDVREYVDVTVTGVPDAQGNIEYTITTSSSAEVTGPLRLILQPSPSGFVHQLTGLTAGQRDEVTFSSTQEVWMYSEVFDGNPIPGGVQAKVQLSAEGSNSAAALSATVCFAAFFGWLLIA